MALFRYKILAIFQLTPRTPSLRHSKMLFTCVVTSKLIKFIKNTLCQLLKGLEALFQVTLHAKLAMPLSELDIHVYNF